MKIDELPPPTEPPPAPRVALALAGIEASRAFRGSARHRALLRYLVGALLDDRAETLKESVIAVEVFGRSATGFDPQHDSIVRVEARRLRGRLARYYADEGRGAALRVELPVGSYVPVLRSAGSAPEEAAATRRARDLCERGDHFLRQPLGPATLEQARERFEAALRESPQHAPACVGLARAWLNLATGGYRPPRLAADHAGEALRRALALAPDDPTALALLGALQHQFEHDWPAAERSFRRAVARAPGQAFVHTAYGHHLTLRGRADDAERELLLARRLDPQYLHSRMHMVNLRITQRRWDQAALEIDALRDLAPGAMPVAGLCGALALFRGDAAAARLHYEQACALQPGHPDVWCALAAALAFGGDVAAADALLAELPRRVPDRAPSPYLLAIVAARSGRADTAFAALEACRVHREPNTIYAPLDPSFDALRGDPRWAAWLRALDPALPGARAPARAGGARRAAGGPRQRGGGSPDGGAASPSGDPSAGARP